MTDIDVAKLAELSRIAVSNEELEELQTEIPRILDFVAVIQEAGGEITKETGAHYNVMREDVPREDTSSECADALIDAMPESHERYLKVRKILSQD